MLLKTQCVGPLATQRVGPLATRRRSAGIRRVPVWTWRKGVSRRRRELVGFWHQHIVDQPPHDVVGRHALGLGLKVRRQTMA